MFVDSERMESSIPVAVRTRVRTGPMAAAQVVPLPTVTRSRALILDDCRFIAERVARALSLRGFDSVLAGDGYVGLELLRTHRFDLLVLDLEIPVVDGFTLLRQLRDDPDYAEIPVLVLASDRQAAELDRARALALGASSYLGKPLQLRSLNAAFDSILG